MLHATIVKNKPAAIPDAPRLSLYYACVHTFLENQFEKIQNKIPFGLASSGKKKREVVMRHRISGAEFYSREEEGRAGRKKKPQTKFKMDGNRWKRNWEVPKSQPI